MTAGARPADGQPPTTEQVMQDLCGFFAAALGSPPSVDEDYFASGRLSSLAALQLVVHVERRYEFQVGVADLDLDNFRTIRRIAGFVRARTTGVPPTPPGPEER